MAACPILGAFKLPNTASWHRHNMAGVKGGKEGTNAPPLFFFN